MKNKHVRGPKKTTVSWTSSAAAKGYYLLKCLAILILSDCCRFYMRYESNMYLYVAWFIRHCGLGLICFGLGFAENFLASASHFLASASSFSGLINKPGLNYTRHCRKLHIFTTALTLVNQMPCTRIAFYHKMLLHAEQSRNLHLNYKY